MPTQRKDNGAAARRIANSMCELCVQNQRLISESVDHLLDTEADKDIRQALRALNKLSLNNAEMFTVQGKIADGKSAEAEYQADRAVASVKPKVTA